MSGWTNESSAPLGPGSLAAELEFLRSVDSPTVANAIERFDVRDRTEGYVGGSVRCMLPGLGTMVGQAVTVTMSSRTGPVASRDGYWRMWEALEAAPSPGVLVAQDVSGTPGRCAYFGEVMTTLAVRLGCVGLVTDGGVRDVGEIEALGFHLFATQAVVSHGNFEIVDVGGDVVLDGQVVRTGDILHGDRNGIVIIPSSVLGELRPAVEAIRCGEAELMEYIRSSEFTVAAARRRAGY
jgi:regulator of RNase E activity RraA